MNRGKVDSCDSLVLSQLHLDWAVQVCLVLLPLLDRSVAGSGPPLVIFPSGGPLGVPMLWGAFGCLWLRCPPCLSRVLGGRSYTYPATVFSSDTFFGVPIRMDPMCLPEDHRQ
ncbi:hypothetical protein AMECASPLE_027180 [Ameca splendens]|uniref:Uncharacterized protein n=1 Tax=Ameca splendens TaxID=208324 RepID=A0ABV0XI47_9TELE